MGVSLGRFRYDEVNEHLVGHGTDSLILPSDILLFSGISGEQAYLVDVFA